MATCSVPTCTHLAVGRLFCPGHYSRWFAKGDVLAHIPLRKHIRKPRPDTFADRFWARVDQSGGPDACWPWMGGKNSRGYGQVNGWIYPDRTYKVILTHRAAYILTHGAIPEEQELDHTCHTKVCDLANKCPHRACCNDQHLEPVTRQTNFDRSRASLHIVKAQAVRAQLMRALTHCKYGHLYDEKNTRYTKIGTRYCLTCQRFGSRATRKRKKLAKASLIYKEIDQRDIS